MSRHSIEQKATEAHSVHPIGATSLTKQWLQCVPKFFGYKHAHFAFSTSTVTAAAISLHATKCFPAPGDSINCKLVDALFSNSERPAWLWFRFGSGLRFKVFCWMPRALTRSFISMVSFARMSRRWLSLPKSWWYSLMEISHFLSSCKTETILIESLKRARHDCKYQSISTYLHRISPALHNILRCFSPAAHISQPIADRWDHWNRHAF